MTDTQNNELQTGFKCTQCKKRFKHSDIMEWDDDYVAGHVAMEWDDEDKEIISRKPVGLCRKCYGIQEAGDLLNY